MTGSVILGFFDGIHLAHRKIIHEARNFAEKEKCILITFKQSPSAYFGNKSEYIMTRKDSVKKMKELGVDEVIELDFPEIANITAEEYLKYVIDNFKPLGIFTGYNHTFGKNKQGTPDMLNKYADVFSYKYFCIPKQTLNGEVISSTHIKELLSEGNAEHANTLLGSNFSISGTVIEGNKIGRTIGFPTANFEYPNDIVKLPYGVYKVFAGIDNGEKLPAIMNWGLKPTVNNTSKPIAEVHIINFNENIYGKNIHIEVIKQIRKEIFFNSIDDLKAQIEKDIKCLE